MDRLLWSLSIIAYLWSFEGFIMALLAFVFGNIYVRVACELMVVLFKINENIASVNEHTKPSN